MQFIHQPLTWAFFLVLLPVVIHLINMMRHKRVQWAAMDFLLISYKKHRRWVWLKQLLLLLLRMLAIAAVVAMLAKLVTDDQWSSLFGRRTTHHFVLLDDSLSMSDRAGGSEAFDRARQSITRIMSRSAAEDTSHKFTLLRFSKSSRMATVPAADDNPLADLADLNAQQVSTSLEAELEEKGRAFDVTELAVGPERAVQLVGQLIEDSPEDRCVLHIVSDFRQQDWNEPAELRDALGRLAQNGTEIRLIRCASSVSPNLAVVEMETADGTQAAGVPLFINVKVHNYASTPVQQVPLKIRSTFHPTTDGIEAAPQTSDLPDVLIERIGPNETVSRQFQVFFPTSGQHVVLASVPADAVAADNQRWCVIDLPDGESVLVVDGDPEEQSAYYLESVFQPGSKTRTGIIPTIQAPNYLRDATTEELMRHRAIYLLNVSQLDQRAVDNLQQYVESGGGLAIFVGENYNARFYNNWYADGTGLFPIPVDRASDLDLPAEEDEPDIQFLDHPIFRVLLGERNPFARSIRIRRYLDSPELWKPPADSTIEVLARLRNRKPLIVQRQFGDGRVVAFLTSVTPDWNNWALEPSFIVVALQLQSFISNRTVSEDRLIGGPLQVQVDAQRYRPGITFVAPVASRTAERQIEMTAKPVASDDSPLLSAVLGIDPQTRALDGQTDLSGIYEARLRSLDGLPNRRRYALNVNTIESDLTLPDEQQLRESMAPVQVVITDADQLLYETDTQAGYSWSYILLWVLIGMLLIEQILAYSASYHPKKLASVGGAG